MDQLRARDLVAVVFSSGIGASAALQEIEPSSSKASVHQPVVVIVAWLPFQNEMNLSGATGFASVFDTGYCA